MIKAPSPLKGTYACADDNAGEVMPGDTITCTLILTTTSKVTLAAAELHLPASTLYVSGSGSPESVIPSFDGTMARFVIPNLDTGGPRTVSMKVKVKKDTQDETVLISKAEYKDGPRGTRSTMYSLPLATSAGPAKPDVKPGQPQGPGSGSPDNRPPPKGQLKAIEGVSFSINPGDTQDVHASSLATRTGGKPGSLRFRGSCTGQKNGTVTVLNDSRTINYKNNGAAGKDTLTCEIVDVDARNAARVQSQVTIDVK